MIPRWAREKLFPLDKGPFTSTTDGRTVERQQVDSIILACCTPCNDHLARRFENPGKDPAGRLLTDDNPSLTVAESKAASLWLLKTWLLLSHPNTEYSDAVPRVAPWSSAPASLFDWLTTGGEPPECLTLWAHRVGEDAPSLNLGRGVPLGLPTIVTDSGSKITFLATKLRLGRTVVTLVFHPAWPVDLDSDIEPSPRRLWPHDDQPVSALPLLTGPEVRWKKGPEIKFRPGLYGTVGLPPLRPDVDPLPGIVDFTDWHRTHPRF